MTSVAGMEKFTLCTAVDEYNLKNPVMLCLQTGKRMEENKLTSKQKAADTKRIQDLERQVGSVLTPFAPASTSSGLGETGRQRSHTFCTC